MSERPQIELPQAEDLERGNSSRQNDTTEHPEPTYQRPNQRNPVLGSTALQDVDLERGEGLGTSTINKNQKASKKKRYIFGVPDNPFDDSESDNEWMRRDDENEPKTENNNSEQRSEQHHDTCCQSISRGAHKIPFVAYVWFTIFIGLLLLGVGVALLVLFPRRKK
ncbi:hypothetical protein BDV37DRAFT_277460 [Aspergillus pseudonomiae]|uniref:Uncharacterized protein n=1 Tax=Aspergillus pseudonomiae TaxID=1506151 RepID=A0A5N7DTX0_9EURO|nr:uncharacterized protein BDV37DRAFT_277460 [Aspergillus pseudonomiae]KAE8409806.1 hypothetical protein BDV37DRAFT_277460 [Aspergillus pseudonomiae]